MPIHAEGPAPYAPPAAVLSVVSGYRDRGLTKPFNASVLERAGVSESLIPRTLQALKLLGLIDDDGQPTAALEDLRKAASDQFGDRLAAIVHGAYDEVFQFADPSEDPPEKVRDAFRVYTPVGQQERMVTLFMGLCEAAGIAEQPKRRRVVATKTGGKSARTAKATTKTVKKEGAASTKAEGEGEATMEFSPSPAPATGQHPFIRGLIQALPPVNSPWPMAERVKWTKAALAAFDLMYELPPEDRKGGDES